MFLGNSGIHWRIGLRAYRWWEGGGRSIHEEPWILLVYENREVSARYRVCLSWIGIRYRFELLDARYGECIEKCNRVKAVAVQRGLGEIWDRKYDYSTQTKR
jgi:hypothetical protein